MHHRYHYTHEHTLFSYYKLYVFNKFSFIHFSLSRFCAFMFLFGVFMRFCKCHTVDAVYAMAHALHKIINEHCKDVDFSQCDVLQAGTIGPDLLRAIREVDFIGMQGTQVSDLQAQCVTIVYFNEQYKCSCDFIYQRTAISILYPLHIAVFFYFVIIFLAFAFRIFFSFCVCFHHHKMFYINLCICFVWE